MVAVVEGEEEVLEVVVVVVGVEEVEQKHLEVVNVPCLE